MTKIGYTARFLSALVIADISLELFVTVVVLGRDCMGRGRYAQDL